MKAGRFSNELAPDCLYHRDFDIPNRALLLPNILGVGS